MTASRHQPHAGAVEVPRQLLLLVELVDGAVGRRQQRAEVERRRRAAQPVVGQLLGVADQSRGLGKDTCWGAAIVGARAPGSVALDEHHPRAELCRPQRCGDAGRAAADDGDVEGSVGTRAHRPIVRRPLGHHRGMPRGPLFLVGGNEFLRGNEPHDSLFADAAARGPAYVVATAASRQDPDRAVLTATAWFAALGLEVTELPLRGRRDAADPRVVDAANNAAGFYLCGGDPGLVLRTLEGTPAWEAIVGAWGRGAALAGSSAGAMALGEWTLLRDRHPGDARRRYAPALGLVRGLAVVPHFDEFGESWLPSVRRRGARPCCSGSTRARRRCGSPVAAAGGRPWASAGSRSSRDMPGDAWPPGIGSSGSARPADAQSRVISTSGDDATMTAGS